MYDKFAVTYVSYVICYNINVKYAALVFCLMIKSISAQALRMLLIHPIYKNEDRGRKVK